LLANRSFYKVFHTTKKETENKSFFEISNGKWNTPKLHYPLSTILPHKTFFQDLEIEEEFPVIGKRIILHSGWSSSKHHPNIKYGTK
jgi:hypothetical protein